MLPPRFRRFLPDWTIIPAAACYSLAFPPYDFPLLIFPAFAFWFASLERAPGVRWAVINGLWLSQIITWLSFTWVAYAIRQFGGLPAPVAYALLVVFGLICQPQFWLFAPLYFWIRSRFAHPHGWAGLLIPLAYAALDTTLPKLFVDTAGHAFAGNPFLRQAADLGGAPLLTFLTVTLALLFYSFVNALVLGPGSIPFRSRVLLLCD